MNRHRRPSRTAQPVSRLAALLGVAGALMLAVGLGFGVAPASAHGAPHASADVTVQASVHFTDPCAGHAASWEGYVDGAPDSAGDGVGFAVTSGSVAPGSTVTVTATAEDGYAFAGGEKTKTFTHTFTEGSADTEVTATVKFIESGHGHQAGWVGLVNGSPDQAGDGVTFEVTSGSVAPGATVTITATAEAGYVLQGGGTTKDFTHTFAGGSANGTEVTATVKFIESGHGHQAGWVGLVNGSPDQAGDGVTFEVTSGSVAPGATVTITATAEAGYVLQGGGTTTSFSHTFAAAAHGHGAGHGSGHGSGHGAGQGAGAGAGAGVSAGAGAGAGAGQGSAGSAGSSSGLGSSAGGGASASSGAGQSTVPTAVLAGQAGDQQSSGVLRILAVVACAAGVLLLMTSGLVTRRQRAGAHRA